MPAIIRNLQKVTTAKSFGANLTSDNVYLGLGKIDVWDDENIPPIPLDIDSDAIEIKRNIFGVKKISNNDFRQACLRINWVSGTIYTQYDSYDSALYTKNFYVLNSSYEVFKCLDNNNGGLSTSEPTTLSVDSSGYFNGADGYLWKHMYSLTATDQSKFLTNQLIPIRNYDFTTLPLIQGEITGYKIVNAGSSYTTATAVVEGDGVNATLTLNISGGQIVGVNVTNRGSGYTYADIVVSGDGVNAILRPIISPKKGHGFSNVDELYCRHSILTVEVQYDETGDFLTTNDFRQVSILKNPLGYNINTYYSGVTGNCNFVVKISNTPVFSNDMLVNLKVGSTISGTAKVASYYTVTEGLNTFTKLELTNIKMKNGVSLSEIDNVAGLATATFSVLDKTYPELDIQSSQLMYTSNRKKVERDISQKEIIKFQLSFG